jgi:hypothetical protein
MAADRPTLAALLRGRSRGDVAAFVAALYAARGAATRIDGDAVVIDGDRVVVVPAGPFARLHRLHRRLRSALPAATTDATPPPTVDRVVAVDAARTDALAGRYDAPVLTPADLDRLARYGLDRAAADAVYRDHLGAALADVAPPARSHPASGSDGASTAASPPSSSASPASPNSDAPGRDADEARRSAAVPAVAAVAAATLVVALVVGSAPLGLGLGLGVDPSTAAGDQSPSATPAETTARTPDGTSVSGEDSTGSPGTAPDTLDLAPGLTAAGVTDADALADAHATVLTNRSYTWTLTYVEFADGERTGRATETVTVATSTVYASAPTVEGSLETRGPVADRPAYADGAKRYHPTADGLDAAALGSYGGVGRQEARARQYFGALLDAEETSVVRTILGGPRLYVVGLSGVGAPTVRNYTATAHVAPDGVVYYYSGSYCLAPFDDDASETCVSVTMRYRNVGGTTVEPPSWFTSREPTSA